MKYPRKLENNDLIKIISPSNGVDSKSINQYDNAIKFLTNLKFNVCEDKFVRISTNGVSSTAQNRAIEFNSSINNEDIKLLVACSGGNYLIQILDFLKFKITEKNIKWVQGHSDITPILLYLTTKYDVATVYSFNAKTFGDSNVPQCMLENNILLLKGETTIQTEYGYCLNDTKILKKWKCITKNKPIKGRIIGGCLDSIKDLIGTTYDHVNDFIRKYKEDGIVWYFDIANMSNEDIYRTIWQMRNLRWFKFCKGILIGRIKDEITYTKTSLENVLLSNLEDLNIPILINVDIGHTKPTLTIINGSIVKIHKNNDSNFYTIESVFK